MRAAEMLARAKNLRWVQAAEAGMEPMTCHSAGFAPQRQLRLIGLLAENARRYSSGLPLMNVVDKVRGY